MNNPLPTMLKHASDDPIRKNLLYSSLDYNHSHTHNQCSTSLPTGGDSHYLQNQK